MILIDFSSTMHRMVAASTKETVLQEDGTFITEDFIYTKMSPSLLASQFNSIYSIIKEKQFGKDRSSVTTDDILNIASSTINSN